MVKCTKLMVLAIGLMLFALGQPAFAGENESQDTITPQTYSFLAVTNCSFIDSGNGLVSVTGQTRTYTTVDKITTTVYLQKNTSTGYVNVKSWTNSTSNQSSCNASGTITVEKGYEYRAYCYHRAEEGSSIETNTSNTKAYLVE